MCSIFTYLMQTRFDFDQDVIDATTDQRRDPLRSRVRIGMHNLLFYCDVSGLACITYYFTAM